MDHYTTVTGRTRLFFFSLKNSFVQVLMPMLALPLTLNSDFAEGAGIAGGTRGKAHVLAGVICRHVIQDQRAGAVRVLNDDVVRVCLHGTSICVKSHHAFSRTFL